MALMESIQSPLLLRISGASTKDPMQTLPKSPLSAINKARRGVGAVPRTGTTLGAARSSLKTVMAALTGPAPNGSKRIGRLTAVPGAMVSGKRATAGGRNADDEETMPVTVSLQVPLLESVNGWSRNDPTQTLPKSP